MGYKTLREYRVWQGEETYAVVSVDKLSNGEFNVYADGDDTGTHWHSEESAFRYAKLRMETLFLEAQEECNCGMSADECGEVYNAPHGVRTQVVDEEGYAMEEWEY